MTNTTKPALSAAPVAQEPVAIQSLEWAEDDDNGRPMYRARTEVGPVYTIYDDGFSLPPYRLQIHQLHLGSYYNVGPAKDAAQADYEKRIRSALFIPPATSAGVGVDEIARAFEAGALAVHNEWCDAIDRGESDPPFRPDFSEAAHDYALALLSRGSGSDQQRSHEEQSTQNI